jgi:hypothetical protein
MISYQQSIRQKVRLGYFAVVVMILGLSAFTFLELNFLEKKVMSGEAISEFFDTTLEIRRFEKNYVLYEQRSDYDENLQYVNRAGELFDANIAGFAAVPAISARQERTSSPLPRRCREQRERASRLSSQAPGGSLSYPYPC